MLHVNVIEILPASHGNSSAPAARSDTQRHGTVLCHGAMHWLLLILAAKAELEYEPLKLHESLKFHGFHMELMVESSPFLT